MDAVHNLLATPLFPKMGVPGLDNVFSEVLFAALVCIVVSLQLASELEMRRVLGLALCK